MTIRLFFLLLAGATPLVGWVESAEFSWVNCPRPLWERQLVWLKNAGFAHISLPAGTDSASLREVVGLLRRLGLEGDLEGPVPPEFQSLEKAHGGPLTEWPSPAPLRISALSLNALSHSRKLLLSGRQALVWTDVQDMLGAAGFHAGAVTFSFDEGPAAGVVRRSARLAKYWGSLIPSMHLIPGAGPKLPDESINSQQLIDDNGTSLVSVANSSSKTWTGDLKVLYPPLKKVMVLPGVTLPPHDTLWLPVNIPLTGAFGTGDHLVYATAELTSMEYENGILAMEFSAPAAGEAILQMSRQPTGPLLGGGKLADFEWDEHTQRVRLTIPKGTGPDHRVRIGLAVEAPDATAFFENAHVLLIGESNRLTAEFSSTDIAGRSRLRTIPGMPATQQSSKDDLKTIFHLSVPPTAVEGDHAELALEADGVQMSHSRPEFARPVSVRFDDEVSVRLAANSSLPLLPPVVPVSRRSGREITISIHNSAPEIRSLTLELKAEGLEFSPPVVNVVLGASAVRDVTLRIFGTGATPGIHAGEARVSGGASLTQPVRFLVLPPTGQVDYTSGAFTVLESLKERAAFIPGRWLELIDKESGQNALAPGGVPFTRPVTDALRFSDLPRPKK